MHGRAARDRFGSLADTGVEISDVRFAPESGHSDCRTGCPLVPITDIQPLARLGALLATLAWLTNAWLAPGVKDADKLVEGVRLYADDPSKGLLQRQDREQHQRDGHRKACGHQDLSNGIFCAEEEAEPYCDDTGTKQHAPHHPGYPPGLNAQQPQSALIAKLI